MKVWLHPIAISKVYHLTAQDQRRILEIVQDNVTLFLEKYGEWHEFDR